MGNLLFIKSGEKKNLRKLQKGKLYMRTFKYYAQEVEPHRRDILEGYSHIWNFDRDKNYQLFNISDGWNVPILNLRKRNYNGYIFCLHIIDVDKYLNQEGFKLDLKGKDFLLINGNEFLHRLDNALKSHYNEFGGYQPVVYKDFKNYTGPKSPFEKDNSYCFEREWRLYIARKELTESIELKIKSIKDISEIVSFKDGKDGLNSFLLSNTFEGINISDILKIKY